MSGFKGSNLCSGEADIGSDLYIIGGPALVNSSPSPNVFQYHGLFYDHVPPTGMNSPEFNKEMDENYLDYVTYADDRNKQNQVGSYHTYVNPLEHNKGKPPRHASSVSRPQSAKSAYSSARNLSRPNSATRHIVSRPNSAVSRHVVSRPDSAASMSSHIYGQKTSPDLPIDPDHEPIDDVLSRLGDYTRNYIPDTTLAYVECECSDTDDRVPSRLAKVGGDGEDEDADDSKDQTVEIIFKTFKQYEDKGHSTMRQKAMVTLINSYNFTEQVQHLELDKVMTFLTNSVAQVQEACMILLQQLVKHPCNLEYLLNKDIISVLYNCLITPELSGLRRQALLLTEVIFSCHQYKDKWLGFVTNRFLPKLISMVRGQTPLDVKYAACCVFRSLAQYEKFIGSTTEEILPTVIMLRNASAKFKEVYVEILTTVLSHTNSIPPDLVDSSAIPITVSIIREGPCGPQCAALHLLTSLTTNDNGVSIVTGTNNLVAMILCCLKDSHCRSVRLNALEVLKHLSTSRKIGLCKDFMLQLSGFLLPSLQEDSLTSLNMATNRSPSPVKPQFDEERHMWQGLEKFIDVVKDVVYREGKVEIDKLGLVVDVHLDPNVEVGKLQLQILASSLSVLRNICVWPLDKSRLGFGANRIDLSGFMDDEKQRSRLSKVNRGLTQTIWDKVGVVVCDLLASYSRHLQRLESSDENSPLDLTVFCVEEEIHLIHSMLEFLQCASLCTCVEFPEITPTLQQQSSKKKSKSKLKSSSTHGISDHNNSSVHCKLKSQSDVGRGYGQNEEKLWVKENPHLTQLNPQGGRLNATSIAKSKAELQHKEACTERRLLRKCLFEAGIVPAICPYFKCSQTYIQILVLQILRCLVHPLEERVAPKLSFSGQGSSSKVKSQRPQTASGVPDTNKRLNIALHKMSPEIAKLVGEALTVEEKETEQKKEKTEREPVKKSVLNFPEDPSGLESIHERLQDYTKATKEEKLKKETEKKRKTRPVIDRCRPIALQCRESLLQEIGASVLKGIFSKSCDVKKHCVLLLHDLVNSGEVNIYMTLSSLGCIPKLIDFLRVNESNELLEIIGLIITRLLVVSDPRLRQLFNRHGGQQLLLSMAQYTSGLIKQEVSNTLKTISKLDNPVKKRPVSAPISRQPTKQKVPDIWDHIQERWKHEDQVTDVLRKWTIEDRKLQGKN